MTKQFSYEIAVSSRIIHVSYYTSAGYKTVCVFHPRRKGMIVYKKNVDMSREISPRDVEYVRQNAQILIEKAYEVGSCVYFPIPDELPKRSR